MISLDLMKSSDVRIAGDQPNCVSLVDKFDVHNFLHNKQQRYALGKSHSVLPKMLYLACVVIKLVGTSLLNLSPFFHAD